MENTMASRILIGIVAVFAAFSLFACGITGSGTKAPENTSGDLVVGEILVPAPAFVPALAGSGNEQLLTYWGFFENLLWANSKVPELNRDYSTFTKGIAESWVVAGDGTKVTFKIREGIQFHHDYGELTAHDVAWSLSSAMSEGSVNSRKAGTRQFALSFEATDDRTLVMNVNPENGLLPNWEMTMSNQALGNIHIMPDDAVEKLGEEEANITAIGTGPFQVEEWVSDDHITAVPITHYRKTPSVASYKIVLMPEANTRASALKTGQINVARMPLKLVKVTTDAMPGSKSVVVGPPINQVFAMAGNYWAEKDQNGEDVYRQREGFKPDADHPWIGDPDDAAQFENANKVRRALRIGIDRQTIVDEIQSGLGEPLYNLTNAFPGDGHWDDVMSAEYDPDTAKALLAEAGYEGCFPFSVHIAPGKEWDVEVGGAVAQYWRDLGCEVEIDSTDYAAARPLLVNRQKDKIWMIQNGTNALPDQVNTGLRPSGGWNFGVEVPNAIQEAQEKALNKDATTYDERVAINKTWGAYVAENNLYAAVSTKPNAIVLGPDVVSYDPYMNSGPEWCAPETIVLK